MSFADWVRESKRAIATKGVKEGSLESARDFHYGLLRNVETALADNGLNVGENVLDREWDVLVVADGCRYDLMAETAPEYPFLSEPEPFTSIAGGSLSWMRRTFTATRDLSDVAYVTANPFSSRALGGVDFAVMDEVWRYAWDDAAGTVRAADVTDAAIETLRGRDVDRAIVHYMQPHHPFVPQQLAAGINRENPTEHDTTVWEKLRDGDVERETVWDAYRANLKYVLDSIADLRENVDAPRMAITADHGNALGEWGIYGHGDYPIGALRTVPWCTTTASDERTIDPDVNRRETDVSVTEQLRDLGYR
ncbi:MAG: hydrolase [Haloplanus sp.]